MRPIAQGNSQSSCCSVDCLGVRCGTEFPHDRLKDLPCLYGAGRSRIRLRQTGEVFSLVPPNSTAHNLIMGSIWVDCHGNFSLSNVSTGAKCSLYFTPCGWFSAGRYEVRS